MPDVRNAIQISTSVEVAAPLETQWGTPAIVGVSDATAKETPKLFVNLKDLEEEHGVTTSLYKAAKSLFAQGIRKVMTVAIQGTAPTETLVEAALGKLSNYAAAGEVHGAVLAGVTDQTMLLKLKTFADANRLIFTVTNKEGDTISTIQATAAALKSPNGFFVAAKSMGGEYDLAAAALGSIMVRKPWETLSWKPLAVDVLAYYTPDEVETLESARVNAIINYNDKDRFSSSLSLDEHTPFLDITRTRFYLEQQLKDSVAAGRMAAAKVPFTNKGLEVVRGWMLAPMEALKRDGALASYQVSMPTIDQVSKVDRSTRRLSGVIISATLAGDMETFAIKLNITV